MIAFKLFRIRRDGSLGPLFINKKQRIEIGKWLEAEHHRTPGFAFRPGWHCTAEPKAPHLKMNTRDQEQVWYKVQISGWQEFQRPNSQGGLWYLASRMKVLEIVK